MKGHRHVVDMRMDRIKPALIFMRVDETPPPGWQENPHEYEEFPYVYIDPQERIERLDLRFVVGLEIHLVAMSFSRMSEALYACKAAGAKRVIAATYDTDLEKVTYLLDTETSYTWQTQES